MNDFADWLSPIVVKELRQGMRARAFIGIFLAIQFLMIIGVLVSLSNDSNSRESVTGLFWVTIGIAILVAMPLRGVATLNGEIKGNTLELMLLTQLSAWRITAGKWLALVLQTLLLVCAVLPYVVLRYFMGGVNLVQDLIVLAWMTGGSCLITAFFVGLSPFMQSVVMRICLFGVMPVILWIGLIVSLSFSRTTAAVGPSMAAWAWAAVVLGPMVVLELFEVGVGKIAPAAENHSARKRLIGLVLCVACAGLGWMLKQPAMFASLATVFAFPIVFGALMEETVKIPSVYRPFVRRKFPGLLAGKLLYPGWGSGLLFFMILVALILWRAPLKWGDPGVAFNMAAGLEAFLLPLMLVRILFQKAKSILPFYFGIQAMLFVTAIILSSNFSHNDPHLTFLGPVPTIGFFLHLWGNSSLGTSGFAAVSTVAAAVSLLGLLVLSIKEWKTIGAMESEAARLDS